MIVTGFFGKVPSLGDFVSRGWSSAAREGLDSLLQAALKEVLASALDGKRAIRNAPPIALSIRPGVAAESGFLIVILPSEDRVGRLFPLCAGVQWDESPPGVRMGWPSLEYAKALTASVRRSVDGGGTPESLVDDMEAIGAVGHFAETFAGPAGDETVPRLGADVKLLHLQGPSSSMRPPARALCSALGDSSDVLGLVLDDSGEIRDFAACRRLTDGGALGSLFDGRWEERGWTTVGALLPEPQIQDKPLGGIDDDATNPLQRRIDTTSRQTDSPGSS